MNRNRLLGAPPSGLAAALLLAGSVLWVPLHAQGSFAAKQRVAAPGVGVQGAQQAQQAQDPGRESPQSFAAKVQVASDAQLERARQAALPQRQVAVVVRAPSAAPQAQPVQPVQSVAQPVQPLVMAEQASPGGRQMQAERLGLRVSDDLLELDSGVALLVDANTGEILLGKNDTVVLPIASITKLMTAILVVDAGLNLDQVITITQADVDRLRGSGSRLPVGAQLTRGQALHLALMSSENRAAHALARTFPGGVPQFVRQMNRKAIELGMHDTHFADPTGLSGGNRSSARDLAMLTAASSHRPLVRELSVSPQYQLELGRRVLTYRNSNMLVRNGDWEINLQKTGFIREAGRTLVMQADVSGRSLIVVLLGASGSHARAADAERLRRWVLRSLFSAGPLPADAISAGERERAALRQPG
ncbi:MAG: serine hydrolase [Methylomonas sp.]|jgi:D-alanyl-D-alanine endopeptidase (penicillin-binding protein 7)|nr:serine hydrolase [Methylomonas sp.]